MSLNYYYYYYYDPMTHWNFKKGKWGGVLSLLHLPGNQPTGNARDSVNLKCYEGKESKIFLNTYSPYPAPPRPPPALPLGK